MPPSVETNPDQKRTKQPSARAHSGHRPMIRVQRLGRIARYDQSMILVLSHSHGANFTKQHTRKANSAGKTTLRSQTASFSRSSIQQSAITKTGSAPKFSGQNVTAIRKREECPQ